MVDGIDQGAFDELLDLIRENERTPQYGSVEWSGEERRYEVQVQFEANGRTEPREIVLSRAVAFFEGLSDQQRKSQISIKYRNGVPVSAVLKGTTAELDPERLKEARDKLGL